MPYKLKHKLHMLKNYELPEDGQQFRPKHTISLTNKKCGATQLVLDCIQRYGTVQKLALHLSSRLSVFPGL
jgi:hypothetical protein